MGPRGFLVCIMTFWLLYCMCVIINHRIDFPIVSNRLGYSKAKHYRQGQRDDLTTR